MNMNLRHFLLYFDHSGTERMLALGGSGQSAQETIYTAPLTRSPLVSSVAKLTLSPYLDTKPSKVRVYFNIIIFIGVIKMFCRCFRSLPYIFIFFKLDNIQTF